MPVTGPIELMRQVNFRSFHEGAPGWNPLLNLHATGISLGVCGGERELAQIRKWIDAGWQRPDTENLGTLLAADAELNGEETIRFIEKSFFKNRERKLGELIAAINSLESLIRDVIVMSIELVENVENGTLEVLVSGKLSSEDYAVFEPGVDNLIAGSGKIKILFIMKDFHGWDLGAVWQDMKFAAKHCRDIEKVAMVGEDEWEKWMATICKPFTLSSIKYFDAGEEDAARTWLAASS